MQSSLSDLLKKTEERLIRANISEAELSAKLLLAGVLKVEPREILFYEKEITEEQKMLFENYVNERLTSRPVAYILGIQNFRGLDFFVDEHVLIPRPETEELVDAALRFSGEETIAIDLGTGSGNIPISLQKEGKWQKVLGCDISEDVLAVAKRNAKNLQVDVSFEKCDVTTDEFKTFLESLIQIHKPKFLCITANLPYISSQERDELERDVRDYEPHIALFGGNRGDEIICISTKTVWEVCKKYAMPFFMIHELDDQMSDEVKHVLELITDNFEWVVRRDMEQKKRFLTFRYL